MTRATSQPGRQPEGGGRRPFFGWTVVAGAFTLAVCGWGLGFYGPPVYLHVLNETRGWPVGLISAAITLHYLAGALTVANLPAIYARWGIPKVTKAGALALCLGVVGWSLAASPWQLFLAAAVSGSGWTALGTAAVNAIVSPWFVRNRPAALAMAYNGASVGGVIMSPLWVFAIDRLGFTGATVAIGAIVLVILWILSDRVFASSPGSLGQEPDGDAPGDAAAPRTSPLARPLPGAALWRDRAFVSLVTATSLALFAQVGLLAHLFSIIAPALGAQWAGIAMALVTVAAVTGRSLVGWLMPPAMDRRLVAAVSCTVQVAGCLALAASGASEPLLIWSGVVLFGLGVGNLVSLPPLIAQVEFARADVGRVVALKVAIGQMLYAFAPAAYGLLRQGAPGPDQAATVHIASAVAYVVAAVVYLAGRRRPHQ